MSGTSQKSETQVAKRNVVIETKTFDCKSGKLSQTVVQHEVDNVKKSEKIAEVRSVYMPHTDWALGVGWNPVNLVGQKYTPTQINVDYRLVTDVWLTSGYNWEYHGVLVGVKLEF